MELAFVITAVIVLGGAVAAMSLRNLVHCALCLALTFAGLAAMYLLLQAQFVAFVQLLVYVGAVAVLVVFAILLTRGDDTTHQSVFSKTSFIGISVATLALACILAAALSSYVADRLPPGKPEASVKEIGTQLMTQYVLPLEAVGLLLTAAMIGAVIIAMQERKAK
ncbi:MAG: NADH-quinone oxidoreductase subunit J [Verrucomicrobiota bacterium]